MDVFLSHDWPQGVEHCGDLNQLLSAKSFLRDDVKKKEQRLGGGVRRDDIKYCAMN